MLSVVLLFLYPTLIAHAARLNKCDSIHHYGPHLHRDYSIKCDGPDYQFHRALSIALLLIYGIGIPLAPLVLGWVLRRDGLHLELDTFAFFCIGFRKRWRYWESVNMARKLAVLLIVTFCDKVEDQVVASRGSLHCRLCIHCVHIRCTVCVTDSDNDSDNTTQLQ